MTVLPKHFGVSEGTCGENKGPTADYSKKEPEPLLFMTNMFENRAIFWLVSTYQHYYQLCVYMCARYTYHKCYINLPLPACTYISLAEYILMGSFSS